MDWPADRVERREVASLVPYAKNARTHSESQVAQIAASIQQWGWTNPVLIDPAGGIIAGHGRVLAAQSLGIEEIPVMVADGWSDAQKQAYILADNKLAENAGWDMSMLAGELSDLSAAGFDLSLIGFGEDEIAGMIPAVSGLPSGNSGQDSSGTSLSDRFGIPPFSVLNAREGWWQERKRAWIALGIQSDLGRGAPIGGAPMPLDRKRGNGRGQAVDG